MKPLDFIRKEVYDFGFIESPESVLPESDLQNDLFLDDLDFIELAMKCESEFNIAIPDEDLYSLTKVRDLVDYIEEHNPIFKL